MTQTSAKFEVGKTYEHPINGRKAECIFIDQTIALMKWNGRYQIFSMKDIGYWQEVKEPRTGELWFFRITKDGSWIPTQATRENLELAYKDCPKFEYFKATYTEIL